MALKITSVCHVSWEQIFPFNFLKIIYFSSENFRLMPPSSLTRRRRYNVNVMWISSIALQFLSHSRYLIKRIKVNRIFSFTAFFPLTQFHFLLVCFAWNKIKLREKSSMVRKEKGDILKENVNRIWNCNTCCANKSIY